MDRAAVVIADDLQGKFSEDRALLKLDNKPLLSYVVNAVKGLVDEVIVVASSKDHENVYAKIVSSNARFAVNVDPAKGLLAAALTGFEAAKAKYSLLLSSDEPFVSREVVSLFFELSAGKSAVVPRWPTSEIEPLHAVYHTGQALEAAKKALAAGDVDVGAIVCSMRGVRYVSTLVIEQLDPDFRSFFRVKTPLDLKKAAAMMLKKARKR